MTYAAEDNYAIKLAEAVPGLDWSGVKYHRQTGKSWMIQHKPFRYIAIQETGKVKPSLFVVDIVKTKNGRVIMRMDKQSGETWILNNKHWRKVKQ